MSFWQEKILQVFSDIDLGLYIRNEMCWVPTLKNSGIPNFGIGIPIWWLFNSGIQKKPTGIPKIWNGIGILLPMRVPEIGTKNWNSQPRTPEHTPPKKVRSVLLEEMCVLTWPPEGEGCLLIIRTIKSPNSYPPLGTWLLNLKDLRNLTFLSRDFYPPDSPLFFFRGKQGQWHSCRKGAAKPPPAKSPSVPSAFTIKPSLLFRWACPKAVPQPNQGAIFCWLRPHLCCPAIGLLAPSQRYSTIEEEEACRLWPEKKWLVEKVKDCVVVVPKRKLWA